MTLLLTLLLRGYQKECLVKDLQGRDTWSDHTVATDKTGTLTQNKMSVVGSLD